MITDPIKGQGAQKNVANRFDKYSFDPEEDDAQEVRKTNFTEVFPKTIVNQVKSPDLPMEYSLNPYQGCEHGCSYCFARPTHEYWGYSAGVDFERNIMFKKNAPELLEKFFKKRGYKPMPILVSGNTDCYQPAERKLEITRKLLQLFLDYRHPVNIITKNALVLRDLDILKPLAEQNLVSVAISIPTINEELRRLMEPRTSSSKNKIQAIEQLSKNGIPVHAMIAPVIPGLNSDEILNIMKVTSEAGALSAGASLVRLNDTVEPVFVEWIETSFPDRKDKVLNLIRSMRGGNLGEKRFFNRYEGEGNIAEMIHNTIKIGKRKFFSNRERIVLDTSNFTGSKDQQLRLF
ncbi:radical SAM protein [Elizabethkingia meningoseptica]|uniref:PA0069 family radical SAM protein n=1 Tax=Elizabethkingia meningoseptica TaxID=238 RepID=UPI000332D6D6|nr:PA0069 family radical SAM protein [Elizabethkingia meningoseptica]AQX04321.1 radical SAM protein [Elizabethkingia meningoseptica]AQX46363.1 radical SAM protein [Elizabethkingia meningoseptica]EOR30010.1 Radical SAM domain protein [Elizabethkingia meningoseptica ATCC 13253 = NBRC 12535]KUY18878.1 radical SAM protein [Elizabethkingia meningoseptica]MDE5490389.1 PA0069 family radical SAM protein [Elizabethkingia meningoseptica]